MRSSHVCIEVDEMMRHTSELVYKSCDMSDVANVSRTHTRHTNVHMSGVANVSCEEVEA